MKTVGAFSSLTKKNDGKSYHQQRALTFRYPSILPTILPTLTCKSIGWRWAGGDGKRQWPIFSLFSLLHLPPLFVVRSPSPFHVFCSFQNFFTYFLPFL